VTPGDVITLGPSTQLPWPAEAIPPGWQILRIGRGEENDFAVDLPMVSGSHARLIWNEPTRTAMLEDLGSSNGTAVGSPDRKVGRAVVDPADTVYLGTHPVPVSELLARLHPPRRPTLSLRGRELTIGRDPGCDQVIDLPMVSGRHARLTRSGNVTLIEDLGSRNGTSVNGQRIERAVVVKDGDLIGLGTCMLTLVVDEAAETEKTALSSPWMSEIRRTIAGISSSRWRVGGQFVAALLAAAGLMVLARSGDVAAGLFGIGFVAVGLGLCNACLGIATGPTASPEPRSVSRIIWLGSRLLVLGTLGFLQCALALAIVHEGMRLKGPWVPMLALLTLASVAGLLLGLALMALVPRSAPAPALWILPLGLLFTWLLGGHWRPLPALSTPARYAASLLPTRWAFEGLLLLEAEAQPQVEEDGPNPPGESPRDHDLAEAYFPARLERMGVAADAFALTAILIGLAGLVVFSSGEAPEG
jgi:pSer/pThr/pTyr-binding forkhead associated (FHA) protein